MGTMGGLITVVVSYRQLLTTGNCESSNCYCANILNVLNLTKQESFSIQGSSELSTQNFRRAICFFFV